MISDEILLKQINKLLDKAGTNPLLTPRKLREKAEERLGLQKGDLLSKRSVIKSIIINWWKVNVDKVTDDNDPNADILKSLIKLARLSGLKQIVLDRINKEIHSVEDMIRIARTVLVENNIKLSMIPTKDELKKAETNYLLKKELNELNDGLIKPIQSNNTNINKNIENSILKERAINNINNHNNTNHSNNNNTKQLRKRIMDESKWNEDNTMRKELKHNIIQDNDEEAEF